MKTTTSNSYLLKITAILVRPAKWRRILVPADITLSRLHAVIQIAMGAPDSTQHFFIDNKKAIYGHPVWEDLPRINSDREVTLERVLQRSSDRLAYYCGDSHEWEQSIELLKITNTFSRASRATCVSGNGRKPGGPDRRKMRFVLSAINRVLQKVSV